MWYSRAVAEEPAEKERSGADGAVERERPVAGAAPGARGRLVFAVLAALVALLVALGVFAGLPARWAPVDVPAAIVMLSEIAAMVALLRWSPRSGLVVRATSGLLLAVGLTLIALLVWTGAWLYGVYGPIGKGGALLYFFVAALALPYLVVVPAARLLWIGAKKRA